MIEEPIHQSPGDHDSNGSPFRPIPPELQEVLKAHKKWLISRGSRGKAAELANYNFEHLDLSGVNFREATLPGTGFSGANVHHADFRGANLRDADLSGAVNLQASQLGGADLNGARLPEAVEKFEELDNVTAGSKTAVTLFYSLLLVCVFAWLTIGVTTDAGLLPNTASSNLPLIGAAIPIAGFYLAGPMLLLALYIYFHLHLIRLWEALTMLPAIFPDGRRLDQVAYPWLLNGLVCAHFPPLRRRRPAFSRIQSLIALLLAWWLTPLTLLSLWARYLRRHDWTITLIQTALVALAVWFLSQSLGFMRATLRGRQAHMVRKGLVSALPATVVTVMMLSVTYIVFHSLYFYLPPKKDQIAYMKGGYASWPIYGQDKHGGFGVTGHEVKPKLEPPPPVPGWLALLRTFTLAGMDEAEISQRPAGWTGNISLVKGVTLQGHNLRYAQARRGFLARADLRGADLTGANLVKADLRGADLQGASLYQANLDGALLKGANLEGTVLIFSSLGKSDLTGVDLRGALIYLTDLQEARGLTPEIVHQAFNWFWGLYDKNVLKDLGLPEFHSYNLWRKKFSHYRLAEAPLSRTFLRKASLVESNLEKADLRKANLQEALLVKANLQKANLQEANLEKANCKQANLAGAHLEKAQLSMACLDQADLRQAHLKEVKAAGASFKQANFQKAEVEKGDFSRADFRQANLQHIGLRGNLEQADFRGANLRNTTMFNVRLARADFREARGLTKEHLQEAQNWFLARFDSGTLKMLGLPANHESRVRALDFRGYNLEGVRVGEVTLSGANFRGARLHKVVFDLADLTRANFQGADLSSAVLSRSKLGGADLRANLTKADLSWSDLQKANLAGANLKWANLLFVKLAGADLTGANLKGANLKSAGLEEAKGIEVKQIREACNWFFARFDPSFLTKLGLPGDHTERLKKWDFQGYRLPGMALRFERQLRQVNFRGADLEKASLRYSHLVKSNFAAAKLAGANFQDAKCTGATFAGADLSGANFREANLEKANLSGANLQGTDLAGANLLGANFQGARNLTKERLQQAAGWFLASYDKELLPKLGLPLDHTQRLRERNFAGYKFQGENLAQAGLEGFNLAGADFRRAILKLANLAEANLQRANLSNANLYWAKLYGANLNGANLERADLHQADLGELRGDSGVFGGQLKRFVPAATLTGVNGKGALFWGAHVQKVNFSGSDLHGANFTIVWGPEVDFQGCNLQKVNFSRARLHNAKMQDTDLREANLKKAILAGADLRGARLQGANLAGADLRNANLKSAQGLTKAQITVARTDATTLLPVALTTSTPPPRKGK